MPKKTTSTKKEKDPEQPNTVEQPYKVSWFDRIPYWVKAVFIKYWFFGAIYFFFVMGITMFAESSYLPIYQMLVVGAAISFIVDFFVNPILEAIETPAHEGHYWWMFRSKKFYGLLINLVYGFALGFATSFLCAYLVTITPENSFGAFREPLTFAAVTLILDLAAIWLKNLLVYIFTLGNRSGKEGDLK